MDGHGLLSLLESIRPDVPGILQGPFDDLVQLVRNMVDALDQIIAPPETIDNGKQQLLTHHSTLLDHISTLKTNLDDFQTVYTGNGSNAYFDTAYQAHSQLGQLTDHLSFAASAHDTISTNLGDGQVAQGALFFMMGAMVLSAPGLPEDTPLVAGEGAGAGFSMAALWTAMSTIGTTLTGLTTAALPYVIVALGTLVVAKAIDDSGILNFAKKPRSDTYNQVEKQQFEEAVRRIERAIGRRLTKDERRELHEAITGMKYTIEEIVAIGEALFQGRSPGWSR